MDNFTPEQISEVLALCETELKKMAEDSAVALAKAGGDEPDETSEGSSGPAAPPEDTAPEASAPADEGSAPPEAEASPEASAPEGAPTAPADGTPDEAGEIHPAPTVEQLQAEFEALPDDQLRMMYLAAKGALASRMGAAGGAGAEMSAPAGGPPPAAPPAGPPAMKSEAKVVASPKASGGKITKAELDPRIDLLQKQLNATQETLKAQDTALMGLAKTLATPIRKSVKGISDLQWINRDADAPKAPQQDVRALTKAEQKARLRERVRELGVAGKLTKSDRELVVAFDMGHVDVSKVEHLIVPAK